MFLCRYEHAATVFLWLGFGLHQFLPQKDLQTRNQQIIFRGGLMAFSLIPPSDLICNLWKEFYEIFFKKTEKAGGWREHNSKQMAENLEISQGLRQSHAAAVWKERSLYDALYLLESGVIITSSVGGNFAAWRKYCQNEIYVCRRDSVTENLLWRRPK